MRSLKPQLLVASSRSCRDLSCLLLRIGYIRRSSSCDGEEQDRFPSYLALPAKWPNLPLLTTQRSPLFPRFMRIIDVREPQLLYLMRQQVARHEPYVGVFLRRNPQESADDLVHRASQIYEVGSFGQIQELQDRGDHLRLVVVAYRRIRVVGVSCGHEPAPELVPQTPPHSQHRHLHAQEAARRPRFECDIIPSRMAAFWIRQWLRDEPLRLANPPDPVLRVKVKNERHLLPERAEEQQQLLLLAEQLTEALRELLGPSLEPLLQEPADQPGFLCDLTGSLGLAGPVQQQQLLEQSDLRLRLLLALKLIQPELGLTRLQRQYRAEVEQRVRVEHRQRLLREQLRLIKLELGLERDDKQRIEQRLRQQLEGKRLPKHVAAVIEEELQRLSFLETHSAEFNITRSYLDWLVALPWGLASSQNLDLAAAQRILNEDHFGIEEVKQRVLEFIAVSALRTKSESLVEAKTGRILCLYGAPGVGKTSIARSIARALNRAYFRLSLGGLSDVAELKGHCRTYVGAMPGKLIQCLKKTQTENPLVLLDEIDKLGQGSCNGDPSAALLELLDAEQHTHFLDHYVDVPVDLSQVLFICTANVLERIPEALRDRMELIEMTGYVDTQKLGIARQHLIPLAMRESGLQEQQLCITDDALEQLLSRYCRESGVRSLQQHIERIIRKIAFKNVRGGGIYFIVRRDNLAELVGQPRFSSDRLYSAATPPGVATGLAWTALGGQTLYVETTISQINDKDNAGSFRLTGKLGGIMQESAHIALTLSRNLLQQLAPGNLCLEREHLHLHVPEGAKPKDGPSAGVTIVTALLSLALGKRVRPNVAMSGEVTLTGKVLPVGGIKEKVIAARRCGLSCLILPAENRKDFLELPQYISEGLEVHFVEQYEQVYRVAFGEELLAEIGGAVAERLSGVVSYIS